MTEKKKGDAPTRGRSSIEDDRNNRSSTSPAHWQGEPLPQNARNPTQDIGFDQRGAGRSQQFGRAGDYGEAHEHRERRPQRGERQPDDFLLEHVWDVFKQSGLDVRDVMVRVQKGVVVLEGHIEGEDDRYVLERLAANCRGTVAVENRLDVRED